MATDRGTLGMWKMRVTGPDAYLNEVSSDTEVTVKGWHGSGDRLDWSNMVFEASNLVARLLGCPDYDDIPERYTPLEFGEPEATHNGWVSPAGTQQWFVGVFSVDRGYGGPEEGGWYYDCGDLVQQTAVNSYAEAEALADTLRNGEFPDTGKRYSVLPGEDYSIRIRMEPHPEYFPKNTPHYE